MDKKQELSEFLSKADYEGGYLDLTYHSGDDHFPDELKPLAQKLRNAHDELHDAIHAYSKKLGFADINEAYLYWED